jgi:hypothetical protein
MPFSLAVGEPWQPVDGSPSPAHYPQVGRGKHHLSKPGRKKDIYVYIDGYNVHRSSDIRQVHLEHRKRRDFRFAL